jgi:Fe-S-cluster containining protein
VDTTVLVTPPEAARITWYLQRHPELEAALKDRGIKWGAMFLGGSTGLPVVQLNFIPLDERDPQSARHCPFLLPVYGNDPEKPHWLKMAWCGIREARPSVCRLFPVGRVLLAPNSADRPEAWEYRIVHRCPGFEPAGPGEATPPGYHPPDATQTVRDWLAHQMDSDQEGEKELYMHHVLPAFMAERLHAPTDDSPDGLLPEAVTPALLGRLLYSPPPPPSDPAQDHPVIMAWLKDLQTRAPELKAILSEYLSQSDTQAQS